MTTTLTTCDLYDRNEHNPLLQVARPILRHFGGKKKFFGAMRTLRVLDDNSFVRKILGEMGQGQILVVDGGASLRCALLGDQLAKMAVDNGWSGLIINGCVRDSAVLSTLPLGVLALGTIPRKSVKRDVGECDVAVHFADCRWVSGEYGYADEDGVLLSAAPLH